MGEQLIERGRMGCDAVWQVLGTGWKREETSAPPLWANHCPERG